MSRISALGNCKLFIWPNPMACHMQNPKSVGLRSLLALKSYFQKSIRFMKENYLNTIEDFSYVYHKCFVICILAANLCSQFLIAVWIDIFSEIFKCIKVVKGCLSWQMEFSKAVLPSSPLIMEDCKLMNVIKLFWELSKHGSL